MAKDKYHEHVKETLTQEGWTITHDPYYLPVGRRRGFIDLGAEKQIIGAEKEDEKIAVEIKSFLGASDLDGFEDALGQFIIYQMAIEEKEPSRILYLALPQSFYDRFFDDQFFIRLAQRYDIKMIVFDESKKSITLWKR